MTPFPATAPGNALLSVVCGLLGGSTLTFATEPIIVTEVPAGPVEPVGPVAPELPEKPEIPE